MTTPNILQRSVTPLESDPVADYLNAKAAVGPAPERTSLTPTQEAGFQRWAQTNKITDVDDPASHYDYRGFWLERGNVPVRFGVDHFPDTYKQHGHPTFSVESKYSAGPNDGGHWNGNTFVPPTPGDIGQRTARTVGGNPTIVRGTPPTPNAGGGEYRTPTIASKGDTLYLGGQSKGPQDFVTSHEWAHRLYSLNDPDLPNDLRPQGGLQDPALGRIIAGIKSRNANTAPTEEFARAFSEAMRAEYGSAPPGVDSSMLHRANPKDVAALRTWITSRSAPTVTDPVADYFKARHDLFDQHVSTPADVTATRSTFKGTPASQMDFPTRLAAGSIGTLLDPVGTAKGLGKTVLTANRAATENEAASTLGMAGGDPAAVERTVSPEEAGNAAITTATLLASPLAAEAEAWLGGEAAPGAVNWLTRQAARLGVRGMQGIGFMPQDPAVGLTLGAAGGAVPVAKARALDVAPEIQPTGAQLASVGVSPPGFGPRPEAPPVTPEPPLAVPTADRSPSPTSDAARASVRALPKDMEIIVGKGKTNYGKLSEAQLVDALVGEQALLEKNANNPARGGYLRYDDDVHVMRSGGTLAGGIATKQAEFALARIARIENELGKRGMTADEIAGHRMGATERAGMAADEGDTSFDFGSEPAKSPTVEYRNVGISLSPEQLKAASEAVGEAVTSPNARVSAEHPSLDQAIASANAMTPENAATFVRQLGGRVLRGLSDEQKGWFGKRLVADQLEAEAVRKAADPSVSARLASEAQKIRTTLPPGIETQPWFQRALSAHKQMVQPFTEAAATEAGVDPGSFRQPSLGGYVRLIPQDRLAEGLISRTQDIAASQGAGAVTPRTGIARKLLGQKRGVIQVSPAGTETPLQGPANVAREASGTSRAPSDITKASGSSSRVVGTTRGYSTDYLTNIAYDAADKVSKATQNQIYRAIANDKTGKIVELPSDQNAPPGQRVIAFDDRKQLVQPPPPGQPIPPGLRRFAVPEQIASAVKRYQSSPTPPTVVGKALRSGLGAITRSVLSNPMVAAWHSATLASSVGTAVPEAGLVASAASHLPIAKTGVALARFADVNFSDPATITRLQRLARNGALRLSDERGRSILSFGHKMLFGPEGVDMRARIVASEDFQKAAKAQGLASTDAKYAVLERNYVNEHAGNYVGKNQGTAVQWLQDSGITPFIAINRAKWGTSLKSMVGSDGTPSPSVLRRLSVAVKGPLGTAGVIAAAGYALSGHGADQNAPGHEADLATGVYHLPDGSMKYRPGAPRDVLAQFPKGTKELYVKGSLLDPATSGARRLIGPLVGSRKGNLAEDETRAVVNEAMQLIGPGPQAAFSLGTGRTLHIGMDNDLSSIEDPHITGDARMRSRITGALRSANAAAAMTFPPTGDQPRNYVGSRFFSEANPLGRESAERRQEGDWQDAIITRIYGEPDPAKKQQIMDRALNEAEQYGYNPAWLRGQFTKALNRSAAGSSSAGTKFLNRLKGGVP